MEQQKSLESMSINELKICAYDLLASQEQTNRNLQAVNKMIAKKYEESKTPVTPTEEV